MLSLCEDQEMRTEQGGDRVACDVVDVMVTRHLFGRLPRALSGKAAAPSGPFGGSGDGFALGLDHPA